MQKSNRKTAKDVTILHLAFRPFFIVAACFSIIAMLIWFFAYNYHINLVGSADYNILTWHAHEMIYGYAIAVIAGFLLTAVKNWTNLQTIHGIYLLMLVFLWIIARVITIFNAYIPLYIIAIIDNAFILCLIIFVMMPIVKTKQKRQIGIIAKLWLLLFSNILFYFGLLGFISNGANIAIYSGLILIIGLILTLLRRVLPFFVKTALAYEVKNSKLIDNLSLIIFFIFWIFYSINQTSFASMSCAAALCVIHSIRLGGYYTNGIWKQSLLWSMFVSYACIVLAFALIVLSYFMHISPFIAIHAFAIGGIGVMTIALMSRVSLGHTARNLYKPPKLVKYFLALLCLCAIIRIIFPLFDMQNYKLWIYISQLLWVAAYLLFLITFTSILIYRRLDGKDG